MKLIYRIISRLVIALLLLLAAWATLFYFIIVDKINEETDDSLEDYSEQIIMRKLAGKELPSADNGTNNSYHIREVEGEYAAQLPHVQYLDREVYIESSREAEPARVIRTLFTDADDRYYELTVMIPTFEKEELRETILWWIVFLYIALLLAVIALNGWIIHRSFKPLYTLLYWLDRQTIGSDIPPLDSDTRVAEFRRLNEAMLRNARRNNEMYEEQRAFIGNASHEMQTPIAIGKSRLELLAGDTSLTEGQLGAVLEVGRTLDHLSKLNRTLLMLTKIENRQIPESTQVDIGRLAESLVADYGEVYAGRGISVETVGITGTTETTTGAAPEVIMNAQLARMLLGNIIKNAFVHSPQGGVVRIELTAQSFSVSNSAKNGPLDDSLIFRRFWQGGGQPGSMGLGLSLVESICRLYGMKIVYDFSQKMHRFAVYF